MQKGTPSWSEPFSNEEKKKGKPSLEQAQTASKRSLRFQGPGNFSHQLSSARQIRSEVRRAQAPSLPCARARGPGAYLPAARSTATWSLWFPGNLRRWEAAEGQGRRRCVSTAGASLYIALSNRKSWRRSFDRSSQTLHLSFLGTLGGSAVCPTPGLTLSEPGRTRSTGGAAGGEVTEPGEQSCSVAARL